MKKTITRILAILAVVLLSIGNGNAQTVLFLETFNQLTTENTTGNALTGGLTDETGYVVGGGGSGMLCSEDGTMNLTGGRFETRQMDLTGDDVFLYVTYKRLPEGAASTSRFQIDVDKTGTSGMGTLFAATGVETSGEFTTQEFAITSGTETSYVHFRTESGYTIVIKEIKIVKGKVNTGTSFVFLETFNQLTTVNTAGNALTGGLTDETGYVVGGGGSGMLCSEDGTMNLTGGRFETRTMDLTGDDVFLYVTYKRLPEDAASTSRFQIDVDKTGTSGMGTLFVATGVETSDEFITKEFAITAGTETSYIHFRTESGYTIVLDEIKVVKGTVEADIDPEITSFVVAGIAALIDDEAGTITAELPAGTDITDIEPEVTMNDGGDHYTPTGAQDFTEPVTYTVYNIDESKSKVYEVTLTVALTLSEDASLKDIKFKDATIDGFAAETTEYDIELPYGSEVPDVADITAATTHPNATIGTITRSSDTFPTDITIPVTAEDETATAEYVIHFTQTAPGTDTTLKSLVVNGNTISLEAGKTDYTVDLPHTTTEVPPVVATANDPKATVEITDAADLEGQTIIDVTAEDGVTKTQYKVSFNVLPPPTKPVTIWNFSDFPLGAFDREGETINGLTIMNHPTGTSVDIDGNSKSIDGFSFTQRLRLGGAGSPEEETPYLPTVRYVSFDTKGDVTITIYGMSSSGGAERTVAITDGENEIGLFTDDQQENTIKKGVIEYTGPAATIYMYSLNSGFNLYAIIAEGYLDGTGIKNVISGKEAQSVSYYDMLGRPVPAATTGLIIVKTTYVDGSSTASKVYRLAK